MDDRLNSLNRMRQLTETFLASELNFQDFFSEISEILGTNFDGIESLTQDLPKDVQEEIRFYSKWTGGEFGETDHLIPKRDDWKYGEDRDPYSWIDQDTYKMNFTEAFEKFKNHKGS